MLDICQVSCQRNNNVLFKDLNFTLRDGEALQICASNGIGKSTLLKAIAGLLPINSGSISYNCNILFSGHKNNLHPALTVAQNLNFVMQISNSQTTDIDQALELVGLLKLKHMPCDELSAGQLQRIIIALLNVSQHKLWLLDEPLINLDLAAKQIFYKVCRQHLTRGGMLIIAAHETLDFCQQLNLEEYA